MRTLGWGIWLIYLGTEYWTLRDVTWRMFFSFCAPKKKNGEQKLNWGNFFLGSRRRAITDSEKCPKHKLKSKFRWWIVVEQVFFCCVSLSLSGTRNLMWLWNRRKIVITCETFFQHRRFAGDDAVRKPSIESRAFTNKNRILWRGHYSLVLCLIYVKYATKLRGSIYGSFNKK